MKSFLILLFILFLNLSFSQSIYKQAYNRTHSLAQVICQHPGLIQGESELVLGKFIKTKFKIGDFHFEIKVDEDEDVLMTNREGYKLKGSLKRGNKIKFKFRSLNSYTYNKNIELGLISMQCRVGMWYDKTIKITDKKIHINVHPHIEYDPLEKTTKKVESLLKDKTIKSYVLLDNYSWHYNQDFEDFLETTGINIRPSSEFTEPSLSLDSDNSVYVAPAGHIFYEFYQTDVEAIITGGNLNYCISNNILFLIDGHLQNNTHGSLHIKLDLDAVVAEGSGWIGPRFYDSSGNYNGVMVREFFRNNPLKRDSFNSDLLEYLEDKKFSYNKRFYKKVNLYLKSNGKTYEKVFHGSGHGEYKISLEYINE